MQKSLHLAPHSAPHPQIMQSARFIQEQIKSIQVCRMNNKDSIVCVNNIDYSAVIQLFAYLSLYLSTTSDTTGWTSEVSPKYLELFFSF